jgi:hypothetical protein
MVYTVTGYVCPCAAGMGRREEKREEWSNK